LDLLKNIVSEYDVADRPRQHDRGVGRLPV
jgi:hypothetical protein